MIKRAREIYAISKYILKTRRRYCDLLRFEIEGHGSNTIKRMPNRT
jgi:hypothetical protein